MRQKLELEKVFVGRTVILWDWIFYDQCLWGDKPTKVGKNEQNFSFGWASSMWFIFLETSHSQYFISVLLSSMQFLWSLVSIENLVLDQLIDAFLYSYYLSAWYGISTVKRNSILITYGSWKVMILHGRFFNSVELMISCQRR